MSELNIGGGCHECGAQYEHKEFCSKKTSPPVYDLAEFERQLVNRLSGVWPANGMEARLAIEHVLGAIKASKRDAQ